MSYPSLPTNIATQWVAAEVKRHLSHLPARTLELFGCRFTLDFKTSEYCVGESRFSLRGLFVDNTSDTNSKLVEFENDDAVVYVSIPPSTDYPFAIERGVAIDKDIIVIFSTGSPMRIYKRSVVTPVPDDFIMRDLPSSAKTSNGEFPDYPEIRAQILIDIEAGVLPKEELETVKSADLFRVKPFWKNVQDLYTRHYSKDSIYFYRILFPEEVSKDYGLTRIRACMMNDIDAGILPPETATMAMSPHLFLSSPHYQNALEIYKGLNVRTPFPILARITKS